MGEIDSFPGFEYGEVITLASRVFHLLLPLLPTSLRFLRIFDFVGSHGVPAPPFLPTLTIYSRAVPLLGFSALAFVKAAVGIVCRGVYSADSSASLAQCGFCGGFFPEFRDFRASLGSS